MKLLKVIFFLVLFLIIIIFLVCVVFRPKIVKKFSGRSFPVKETYSVDKLQDNKFAFPLNGLGAGYYDLGISYVPYDPDIPFQPQKPFNFEASIQLQRGKKIIEKTITKTFENDRYESSIVFWVPIHFFWGKNTNFEIIINNIKFDDEFSQYFKEVHFLVRYINLLSG